MSLLVVLVQTETNRELVYSFFKVFYAGIANSPEIEVFRQIFLCLFDTTVNVLVALLPILKVKMYDRPMIEKIGTIGIELIPLLHFF